MIEVIVLNHLKEVLSVPVAMEKFDNEPTEYVLFEKTGGGKNETMPSATFAFQSHSDTLYKTMLLNEEVKEAVESLITLDVIRGVTYNSDYNFPDTTIKKHRYQAVYDIKYY